MPNVSDSSGGNNASFYQKADFLKVSTGLTAGHSIEIITEYVKKKMTGHNNDLEYGCITAAIVIAVISIPILAYVGAMTGFGIFNPAGAIFVAPILLSPLIALVSWPIAWPIGFGIMKVLLNSAEKANEQFQKMNKSDLLEDQDIEKVFKSTNRAEKAMQNMNFEQLSIARYLIGFEKFKDFILNKSNLNKEPFINWKLILDCPVQDEKAIIDYLNKDFIRKKIKKSELFATQLRLHLKDCKSQEIEKLIPYPSVFTKPTVPGIKVEISFEGSRIEVDKNLLKERSGFFKDVFNEYDSLEKIPVATVKDQKIYFQALTDPEFRLTKGTALKLVPSCAFYRDDALLSCVDDFIRSHALLFTKEEINELMMHADALPKLSKLVQKLEK